MGEDYHWIFLEKQSNQATTITPKKERARELSVRQDRKMARKEEIDTKIIVTLLLGGGSKRH